MAGNVANHLDNWGKLTSDRWVLDNIKGVRIPFISQPIQERPPHTLRMSDSETMQMSVEIQSLLRKKVIEPTLPSANQWISNVFLRPKPNGKFRLILDLTNLNKLVTYNHFKMSSLQTAADMLRPNAWLASIDLRDAYYTIPIARQDRHFLWFFWDNVLYQFTAMPNGLACAPRLFTKILTPVFAQLQEQGHECFHYIDDSFIIADNQENCAASINAVCDNLRNLGFQIHTEKSLFVPTTSMTFLGFEISSEQMTISLNGEKLDKLYKVGTTLRLKTTPTIREVATLVGLMVAYSPGVQYGRAHIRGLERNKNLALGISRGNFNSSDHL